MSHAAAYHLYGKVSKIKYSICLAENVLKVNMYTSKLSDETFQVSTKILQKQTYLNSFLYFRHDQTNL